MALEICYENMLEKSPYSPSIALSKLHIYNTCNKIIRLTNDTIYSLIKSASDQILYPYNQNLIIIISSHDHAGQGLMNAVMKKPCKTVLRKKREESEEYLLGLQRVEFLRVLQVL